LTPLSEAMRLCHTEVAKVLTQLGAEASGMMEMRLQAGSGSWAIPLESCSGVQRLAKDRACPAPSLLRRVPFVIGSCVAFWLIPSTLFWVFDLCLLELMK